MKFSHSLDPHWQIKTFQSDGLELKYAIYPSKKKTRNFLFFLPGRGEFLEKFNDLHKRLKLKSETSLVLIDHRGQGGSEGFPFHANSYREYCKDIQNLIKELNAVEYSFFACSMGGLISLYGVQKEYFMPKSLFLVSPLVSLPEKTSWFISRYALLSMMQYLGFGKKRLREYSFGKDFDTNLLTTCQKHYDALKNNPKPPEDGTVSWIRATFRAILSINLDKNIKKSPDTITICLARHEMVVCNQAIYRWVQRHQDLKDKSFINLHFFDTKHEILFDQKEETDRLFSIWSHSENSM